MIENVPPMRKLFVFINLTLDGVMQSPALPEEDPRSGFPFGGWAAPYNAMQSRDALQSMPETGSLLLGRRTYESMYAHWPKQVGHPITEMLNQMEKYVASNTLAEPLPWVNTKLLKGDAAETVAQLKAQPGKAIMVMGSGVLAQTLMRHNLVDLYVLLIHPLVLGTGRRLFVEGLPCANLQLIDAKTTPTGVVAAFYQPVEASY